VGHDFYATELETMVNTEHELRVRRRYSRWQYCEWRRTPNNNHDVPTTRVAFQSWRTTSRSRLGDDVNSHSTTVSPPITYHVAYPDRQTWGQKPGRHRINTTKWNVGAVYRFTESGGRPNKNKNRSSCGKLRRIGIILKRNFSANVSNPHI